jgi:hypothetical protein
MSCKKKKCRAKKKSVVQKKKRRFIGRSKKNFLQKFFALQVIY